MKQIIKNTVLILCAAIILPLTFARMVSENIVDEVKAFSDGFITQVRNDEIVLFESISIAQPKEIPTPKPVQTKSIKPTPTTPPIAEVTNIAYMQQRICEVFGEQCENALIIAKYESGFKNNIVSKTNDYGLFQLNCRWQGRRVGGDCTKFFDFETNLRVAKQIYDEQGWNPWYTKIYLK